MGQSSWVHPLEGAISDVPDAERMGSDAWLESWFDHPRCTQSRDDLDGVAGMATPRSGGYGSEQYVQWKQGAAGRLCSATTDVFSTHHPPESIGG